MQLGVTFSPFGISIKNIYVYADYKNLDLKILQTQKCVNSPFEHALGVKYVQ